MAFPKDFIFAAASASYQVEGAWNIDGKGENIWDRLTHEHPEFVDSKSNGDVACDSYHKYKEDALLLKDIGFDMYRFSISWSRILPTGDITNINEAGLQYYKKLIDELLNNNIIPMITIYHWDLPQRLQDIGGWVNPLIADYCEDYADVLFKYLGDKVKWWITINEPQSIISGYEGSTENNFAPHLHLDSPANYIVTHNILRAHGRIFRLYEKKYKMQQRGKISITLSGSSCLPKTSSKEDLEAANRAMLFTFGWWAHPIYTKNGDYPEVMRQTIDENSKKEGRSRSRLPKFTADEIQAIRGSFDFFATNHYSSILCSPGCHDGSTYAKDMNVAQEFDPSWPSSASSWLRVYPEGFRQLLIWIKNQYNNVPVFITENGFSDLGDLNDVGRESYYHSYLQQLLLAVKEDQCNVIGFTAWSILDNFEWLDGYNKRFGIVHVDFNDPERKRTKKRSASFFKKLLQTRHLPKIENKN